jgi:hypothetical protein
LCAHALRTGDRTTDCALQSAKSSCRSTCWQHVISRCYDSLKRSSGEWKEACTFSSGAWSGAPALHLRAQCTYQEKSEHEHRRTRHKRRALSTGQRTETRTTARPTNKQHTNDWSSAFFRQFRRFAPILEPSLHGARGLTSFIHHASDALRALCSQMGTTYLIQLRPRDHWVRAAHTNFELIESRARHCSSRSVLRDAFQADELGLRISSSPPPWSCHNRKQLRSGLMGPWAISKIEVSLEYCGQSPR